MIEINSEYFADVKNNYLMKNPSAKMYFGLSDLQLYKLVIVKASFVAGFAKSFNLIKTPLQNLTII